MASVLIIPGFSPRGMTFRGAWGPGPFQRLQGIVGRKMTAYCKTIDIPSSVRCLLGLGSNLGNSAQTLADAIRALQVSPGIHVDAVSSLYFSAPVGGVDQPEYCNQAALVSTSLGAVELLDRLLLLEAQFGRERAVRWGPRTLDLDLLFYDDLVLETPNLVLPHPRLVERGFVLAPLVELAPDWTHPTLRCTVKQLYLDWVNDVVRPQEHIRRVACLCPLAAPGTR